MAKFHGKDIPITLEELVVPDQTALVVVDVQNDFCTKGGGFQKQGKFLSKGDAIIKNLAVLIDKAREAGVKIVYIQNTALPDFASESAAQLRSRMKKDALGNKVSSISEYTVEGSWGERIVDEMKPQKTDFTVKKYRSSAFFGTNLDLLLRTNGIKTCLITGVVTQGCVDSTARDAQFHGYFTVIVRDCVDSTSKELHEAALKIAEARYDIFNSDEIVKALKR